MRLFILGIQYHPLPPPNDTIAVLIEDELGLGSTYINLHGTDLPDPDHWTDTMVRDAAQLKLDTDPASHPKLAMKGHTVEFPPPPPLALAAPEQTDSTEAEAVAAYTRARQLGSALSPEQAQRVSQALIAAASPAAPVDVPAETPPV